MRCTAELLTKEAPYKGDRLIEADQSRRLHEALPRSLLHLVEDEGHMVTYADTLAFTAPTRPELEGEARRR